MRRADAGRSWASGRGGRSSCQLAYSSAGMRTARPLLKTTRPPSLSVVVANLENHQVITGNEVHEAMLVSDPSRPRTRGAVLELLGFTDTSEGIAKDRIDEHVDPFEDPAVRLLPSAYSPPKHTGPIRDASVLPVEVMHLRLASTSPVIRIKKASRVLR